MNYLAFLFTVVTVKLAEVLKSRTDCHFVGTCRCNQVVQSSEIDGWKLIYNDRAFKLSFLVYQLDDYGIIQSECSGIDVLSVRIIAYTKDFRLLRIINVQRKSLPVMTQYNCGEIITVSGIFAEAIGPGADPVPRLSMHP